MKRVLIFLTVALLCSACSSHRTIVNSDGTITIAQVPDDNFRNYLLKNNFVKPCDKSKHYAKNTVEVTKLGRDIQLIDCHYADIHSLDGIELFPNLVILICGENPLRRIDVSHNPRLKQLFAIETPLRHIDVSHNPELKVLQVSYTHLKKLDVSHNPKLEELFCIFSPQIQSLDLSHNPMLKTLYLRGTNTALADLRRNLNFQRLLALDCPLQAIVVSPDHALENIDVMVEDGVQLYVLDTLAALPNVKTLPPTIFTIPKSGGRNSTQVVMTFKQAEDVGIDITALREEYQPAFDYNDETHEFAKGSIVRSATSYSQYILTWQLFWRNLAAELRAEGIGSDTNISGSSIVFFDPEGRIDYFLYRLDSNILDAETQMRFEEVVKKFASHNSLGYCGSRKFSQCGSFCIKKPEPEEEESGFE